MALVNGKRLRRDNLAFRKGCLKGRWTMSRFEVLYTVLFIGFFPALWLLAACLDRIWPTTSELDAKRVREGVPHEKLIVPRE